MLYFLKVYIFKVYNRKDKYLSYFLILNYNILNLRYYFFYLDNKV